MFDRCGITMEPARPLVLGMLNVQAVSDSERAIFISFLLNVITSLALGLTVPFLKLRRQQGHLPNPH